MLTFIHNFRIFRQVPHNFSPLRSDRRPDPPFFDSEEKFLDNRDYGYRSKEIFPVFLPRALTFPWLCAKFSPYKGCDEDTPAQ